VDMKNNKNLSERQTKSLEKSWRYHKVYSEAVNRSTDNKITMKETNDLATRTPQKPEVNPNGTEW